MAPADWLLPPARVPVVADGGGGAGAMSRGGTGMSLDRSAWRVERSRCRDCTAYRALKRTSRLKDEPLLMSVHSAGCTAEVSKIVPPTQLSRCNLALVYRSARRS